MANRRRRDSGIVVLRGTDQYGRQTMPGAANLITDRTIRRLRHGTAALRHPVRNGVYDPVTFYHVVEVLLSLAPAQPFTSTQLVRWLNDERDFMSWDATSVGRILNDIHDNLVDTLGSEDAFVAYRDWSNSYYETTNNPKGRAALLRLADDLARLSEAIVVQEKNGEIPKRLRSPMSDCPSIMEAAIEDAA